MSIEQSYAYRRFGLNVAKWTMRVSLTGMLIMLAVPSVVGFMLPSDLLGPGVVVLRWMCVVPSCVGLAILWHMYKSSEAEFARIRLGSPPDAHSEGPTHDSRP
jgi:hypothetical protein